MWFFRANSQILKLPWELWSLIHSIDVLMDSSQVIGFIRFLWNQLSFLGSVFAIIVLLRCPPSFHLHHPGRWQQILSREFIDPFFHFTFLQFYEVCHSVMLKNSPTPRCSHPQTPLLVWCVCGDEQSHLTSKHGVYYYGIQRVSLWFQLTGLYSPSISQACLNVVQ